MTRAAATVLDGAAMLSMAMIFAMLGSTIEALRAGVMPPPLLLPWYDLVRLSRKRRLRPGFASPLYGAWPVVALAASGAALLIVPGFAFGLLTAPLAHVPVVVGLFGVAGLARLAALLESGDGLRGLLASRAAARWLVAMLVWLAGLGALAAQAGTDTLAGIGGTLAVQPGCEVLIVLGALGLLLAMRGWALPEPADYAGPERALFMIEAALRFTAMVAVVLDVVAPMGMADARRVATWPVGLLVWAVAMPVLAAVIMLVAARRQALALGCGCIGAVILLVAVQGMGARTPLVGLGWLIRHGPPLRAASLVQIGVALIGLGFGATSGALLILAVVALARVAAYLAPDARVMDAASTVALAGLPPFGSFAGVFLVARAATPVLGDGILLTVAVTSVILLVRLRRGTVKSGSTPRMIVAGCCLGLAMLLGIAPWLAGLAGLA